MSADNLSKVNINIEIDPLTLTINSEIKMDEVMSKLDSLPLEDIKRLLRAMSLAVAVTDTIEESVDDGSMYFKLKEVIEKAMGGFSAYSPYDTKNTLQ